MGPDEKRRKEGDRRLSRVKESKSRPFMAPKDEGRLTVLRKLKVKDVKLAANNEDFQQTGRRK
jgi:hypothetical protein